mmetsp:Transcript_25785/g.25068  ORF Transcript_25785/g.25068 Transcript_25785/m.25068 type:complete len:88 (-) Transcript_25785:479-742(-)
MWSVGVITYCMLAGYPPFYDDREALLFRKIKMCDYDFNAEGWKGISREAKDFISKLLEPDRDKRMRPEEALNHPWIKLYAPVKCKYL